MGSDEYLIDQRVLVTGVSGFLGTSLSRRLQAVGAGVHAVSSVDGVDRLRWRQVDMENPGAVHALLGEV